MEGKFGGISRAKKKRAKKEKKKKSKKYKKKKLNKKKKDAEISIAKDESIKQIDVAEVVSPPRVTVVAKDYRLKPGMAMDLTNGWDFTIRRHKEAAEKHVRTVKPWIVIGSPECRMFI